MTGETGSYRGLVIRESLRGGELPASLTATLVGRYPHSLGGTQEVEILVLNVRRESLPAAAFELAEALLAERFYAHFVLSDELVVVFPGCVVLARKNDTGALARCVSVGHGYGIPDSQMRFSEMFENDHPDDG